MVGWFVALCPSKQLYKAAAVADRVHFVLECSGLDPATQNYLMKIQSMLSRIDAGVSIEIKSRTADAAAGGLDQSDRLVDDNTYAELESASRNLCFALHSKRVQLPECGLADLISIQIVLIYIKYKDERKY